MNPLELLVGIGSKVIDRLFPDPIQKANAQLELFKLQQSGELAELAATVTLATNQSDTNKVEAANPNTLVSGWRPFIGWVCGTALFTYYVPYCLVATVIWAIHCWQTKTLSPRPDLGIADLLGLVTSMLGVASLRTAEKFKGVAA